MKIKFTIASTQAGQTLIETLVAIFIFIMGITAALGLAVYAYGTSTSITKEIVGVGLAREGIEAVKNMRDTNWLQGSVSNNCYSYASSTAFNAKCYKNWLAQQTYPSSGGFTISPPSNPTNYVLGFTSNSSNPNYWILYPIGSSQCPGNPGYALSFNSNPANNNPYGMGYYKPTCSSSSTSGYYRKIVLQLNTNAPFNHSDTGHDLAELLVKSQVWWVDKNCPPSAVWPGTGKCSVELDTTLTNWNN